MALQQRWACPDLGKPKSAGYDNPVQGSRFGFPDCPRYYLRTAPDELPADHLIDGHSHPASLVAQWAFELEAGALRGDDLSPKARELVHLYRAEQGSRRDHEREENERRRKVGMPTS